MTPLPPQPLSPLDGRYRAAVGELGEHLSEAGLNRARVQVEVEWLIAQTDRGLFGSSPLSAEQKASLRKVVADFGQADIDELADARGRHPPRREGRRVLRAPPPVRPGSRRDRRAHPLRLHQRGHQQPLLRPHRRATPCATCGCRSSAGSSTPSPPSPSSTATPPCSPARTASRRRPRPWAKSSRCSSTASSASPRRSRRASTSASSRARPAPSPRTSSPHPTSTWPEVSREFVESLGLTWNPLTTQIESHDWQAELYGRISHANRVLHNLATDIWTYISLGVLPPDPRSRRDGLVDDAAQDQPDPVRERRGEPRALLAPCSTRSPPPSSPLACSATSPTRPRSATSASASGTRCSRSTTSQRGLSEIDLDEALLLDDLDHNWEVLGEAIQTVIRAEVVAGRSTIADPYALLKELTRGKRVGRGRAGRVRERPRDRRRRQAAPARAHARDVHGHRLAARRPAVGTRRPHPLAHPRSPSRRRDVQPEMCAPTPEMRVGSGHLTERRIADRRFGCASTPSR